MRTTLLPAALVFICALAQACGPVVPPAPPEYSTIVVVEQEPRRTANAEIADIDGDGFQDVVLAIGRHWPEPNLLFRGDGSGGFLGVDTLSSPYDRTYSVTAADMDSDGDIDLVVSNDRPDPKYVLLNDGTGQFKDRVEFGDPSWPTRNSTVADVNLDGRPDVIVANRDSNPDGNNFVCLNTSGSTFDLACQSIISGPATTISVADINGDAHPDIIVPYRDVGQSHVYLGDGTGAFTDKIAFGPSDASFRSAIAIDLNRDEQLDIVAIDDRKNETLAYIRSSESTFRTGFRIDHGETRPYALDKADLDADGREDLLVGYRGAPTQIFFSSADSLVSVAIADSTGDAYGFGIGDINRDGILDIASARSGASDILLLGNRPH